MPFIESSETTKSKLNLSQVSNSVLVGIAALVVVALVLLGQNVYHMIANDSFSVNRDSESLVESEGTDSDSSKNQADVNGEVAEEKSQSNYIDGNSASVVVFVSGSVNSPGVYTLPQGSRVQDAVNAAGGFSDGACTDAVNLARVLSDEEQVAIASQDQVDSNNSLGDAGLSGSQGASSNVSATGLVNINTATANELESLPGVGQATAAKIIASRETDGSFTSIEDIKRVSGIGDKKFEALRDLICV